jgi:hypothetical protein
MMMIENRLLETLVNAGADINALTPDGSKRKLNIADCFCSTLTNYVIFVESALRLSLEQGDVFTFMELIRIGGAFTMWRNVSITTSGCALIS